MGNTEDNAPLLSENQEEQETLHYSDSLEISGTLNFSNHIGVTEIQTPTCCKKLSDTLRQITVEPVLLLDMLGWSIQSSLTTNLLLDKVCREHQYSEEICTNLTEYEEEQIIVQREVTLINMYRELLTALPNILFVVFIGSWSDKYGRKIPLILPLFGSLLGTLLIMMNAYWMNLPSMYILFAGIPQIFTGGFITMLMAAYSYVADITKVRARTTRIAIMDFCMILGAPMGIWLSNWIFYKLSYLGIYGISASMFFIAIAYSLVWIEDTRGPFSKLHLENSEFAQRPSNMLKDLFDLQHVKDVHATCFKPRPNKGRGKLLGLIGSMVFGILGFGLSNISYLYVKRKFGWDYNQYTHLGLVDVLFSITGTSIVLPILSYKLQVHDSLLGLIGCACSISRFAIQGLATKSWHMYLGACVSALGSLAMIVNRSLLSKIVPDAELGKIFAMTAAWEAAVPIMSSPLYTVVYNSTINVFPGAVYLMAILFYSVSAVIFMWLFITRHVPLRESVIHDEETIPDPDA